MMDEESSTSIWWPDSIGRQILPHVRNSLIHATSPRGLRGILKDGYIKINQGQFPYSFPQTPHYFGGHIGGISVFDFDQAADDEIILTHDVWQGFLFDSEEPRFLLDIDREAIADHLVPNIVAQNQKDTNIGFIWYVEAWVKEPIPLSAMNDCLITRYLPDTERLDVFPLDLTGAKKILDLV